MCCHPDQQVALVGYNSLESYFSPVVSILVLVRFQALLPHSQGVELHMMPSGQRFPQHQHGQLSSQVASRCDVFPKAQCLDLFHCILPYLIVGANIYVEFVDQLPLLGS